MPESPQSVEYAAEPPARLIDVVRARLRTKHYSLRTEQVYVGWILRFIRFHARRHPRDMGAPEVEAFLSALAVQGRVAASTQNQALSALLFLYREVLAVDLPWMTDVVRAKTPRRLPTVLSEDEMSRMLAHLDGRAWLVTALLYGTGMRLLEGLRLRVQDLDLGRREILVRNGKGGRDRRTMLPASLVDPLRRELLRARQLHDGDLAIGSGRVWLPMRWCASIPVPRPSGGGSTCSRLRGASGIPAMSPSAGTIWTTGCCRARSKRRRVGRASRSAYPRIRCATRSRRI